MSTTTPASESLRDLAREFYVSGYLLAVENFEDAIFRLGLTPERAIALARETAGLVAAKAALAKATGEASP